MLTASTFELSPPLEAEEILECFVGGGPDNGGGCAGDGGGDAFAGSKFDSGSVVEIDADRGGTATGPSPFSSSGAGTPGDGPGWIGLPSGPVVTTQPVGVNTIR